MDFDTQEANVKLIKQIKLRPCLYNKNLASYNRKSVQDKAWEDVAKYMGWNASQCKERWKNLRCVYIRHIKRISQGIQKKPYYLMELMGFALPFVKPEIRNPVPKKIMDVLQRYEQESEAIDDEETEQTETRKSFESQSSKRHMDSESPEPSHSFVTEFIPSTTIQIKHEDDSMSSDLIPSKNSRPQNAPRMGCSDYEIEMADVTTNIDLKTDARKMFLYSLLPDVYAMTDAQMRQFKLKVLNAIGDIFDAK